MAPKRQMTHVEHIQNTVIEEVSGMIDSSDAELQAMTSVTQTKNGSNKNNTANYEQKDSNISASNAYDNKNLHQ